MLLFSSTKLIDMCAVTSLLFYKSESWASLYLGLENVEDCFASAGVGLPWCPWRWDPTPYKKRFFNLHFTGIEFFHLYSQHQRKRCLAYLSRNHSQWIPIKSWSSSTTVYFSVNNLVHIFTTAIAFSNFHENS